VLAQLGDEVPEGDPERAEDGDGVNAVWAGDMVTLALAPRVDVVPTVGMLLTPLDDALFEEPTIGDDDTEIELDCIAPCEVEGGDTLEGILEDVSVATCAPVIVEGDACEVVG